MDESWEHNGTNGIRKSNRRKGGGYWEHKLPSTNRDTRKEDTITTIRRNYVDLEGKENEGKEQRMRRQNEERWAEILKDQRSVDKEDQKGENMVMVLAEGKGKKEQMENEGTKERSRSTQPAKNKEMEVEITREKSGKKMIGAEKNDCSKSMKVRKAEPTDEDCNSEEKGGYLGPL
mgnify:CR=1 FL=1